MPVVCSICPGIWLKCPVFAGDQRPRANSGEQKPNARADTAKIKVCCIHYISLIVVVVNRGFVWPRSMVDLNDL